MTFDELAREVEAYIKDAANVHIGEHIVPAALRAAGVEKLVEDNDELRTLVDEGKLTDSVRARIKAEFREVVEDFRASFGIEVSQVRVIDDEEAEALRREHGQLLDAVDALWGWMGTDEVKAIQKEDPELAKLAADAHESQSHGAEA